MEFSFDFESESLFPSVAECTLLEVTIDVWCHSDDGDFGWEELHLYDKDHDCEVKSEQLSERELARIKKFADELAYEKAPDAYQEYCEGRADAAYDAWKDRQMEDSE